MVDPIVTTDDLDAYLAGDKQKSLDAATAAVRAYCGWHVTPVISEAVRVDVSAGVALLPSLHVVSVESVTDGGVEVDPIDWTPAGVVRVAAHHRVGLDLYDIHYGLYGHDRRRSVEVSFTHGFEDAPDVAGVIMSVAARYIATPSGVVRAQVGQVSETYTQTGFNQSGGIALLDADMAILDRYKLPQRP